MSAGNILAPLQKTATATGEQQVFFQAKQLKGLVSDLAGQLGMAQTKETTVTAAGLAVR